MQWHWLYFEYDDFLGGPVVLVIKSTGMFFLLC